MRATAALWLSSARRSEGRWVPLSSLLPLRKKKPLPQISPSQDEATRSAGTLHAIMERSCLWYIRNLNFFPQLTEAQQMDLAASSKMIPSRRGHKLNVATTAGGNAYLIKEGHVRLLRAAEGREVAVDLLGPGDVLGLTPILTEDSDADHAEVLDDVLFCRVPARILRELLEATPGLALHFSKQQGLRRKTIELRLIDIAFCTVKVRIARLLAELAKRFGEDHPKGRKIGLKLTQREIAEMVGSNREAANRATLGLVDAGAIEFEGKNIVIVNSDKLAHEAQWDRPWQNVS